MDEPTDAQIDAATKVGRDLRASEPRASAVYYDRGPGRIVVVLNNGCLFAFPPDLAQGLEAATAEQLADVRLLGAGYGLHWEELDVDLSVPGVLAGKFGTASYMAARGGGTTSPAKAAAARANGAKGGRPRKAAKG